MKYLKKILTCLLFVGMFQLITAQTAGSPYLVPISTPISTSNPAGTGSFFGKTCFDIVLNNDNANSCGSLSARSELQANFTLSSTHTQSYTFMPRGIVSNVRFTYVNTNGSPIIAISGGNSGNNIASGTSIIATVNYSTSLNTTAALLTNDNPITADIYAIYNDGATNNGTDRQLKVTAKIKDCACCMAKVSATVWKEFLCHNLGADTSLDPHIPDVGLQGAYIQWGKRGPSQTNNPASIAGLTDDSSIDWQTYPSNGSIGFGAAPTASNDNADSTGITGWSTSIAAAGSWTSSGFTKPVSDPCPSGYRMPTQAEWLAVSTNNAISRTGTFTNGSTQYGSAVHYGPNSSAKFVTLPMSGQRNAGGGAISGRGSTGYYWSGTEFTSKAYRFFLHSTGVNAASSIDRTCGQSIRCIAQ